MLTSAFLFLLLQAPAAPQPPDAPPAPAPPAVAAPAGELLQIRHVYLLPMSYSFDQFLANHLTRSGLYQVVTDPAKADAIFTDRLGRSFESKLEELYPSPKHEEEVMADPPPQPDDADDPQRRESVKIPIAPQERLGGGGRGKGTYFLVNRSTRNVVWSTYERSRTSRADDLNDTAKDVVARLEAAAKSESKAVNGKKGWRPW
ncbi:hypothetical protein [uncultured Paludibaculum sp.]|uniref:hypothetical protein n=1 Tax=uncultured Paludibaculum sp. TaxID=1765020 RepID=UPI002AAAFD35|nr:hypothetical protein [uncultured Paludibaculum sp.]